MRKKIIAGNWKMNLAYEEAITLLKALAKQSLDYKLSDQKQVIIATPFPYLQNATAMFATSKFMFVSAQNCSEYEQGAYTGEVSAKIIASLAVQYVIVGHSERRQYFYETDEIILQKILQAQKQKITPIFCCGEPLEIRLTNQHFEYVQQQLQQCIFQLDASYFSNCVIAYEPIWAIGTGKTATPEQAQEMHAFIRNEIAKKYSPEIANKTTILYGGSVNAKNAAALFICNDIDGGLVGGASLNETEFSTIVNAIN